MMAYTRENFKRDSFITQMLVSRDFKLKYRRSFLGIVWSILNPLLMMLVLAAVFSFFFERSGSIENFAVYLIIGLTLFNLMSVSTGSGVMSIINAAPLIKKIRVNKLVFPLETVLFELVNYALSLIAVALVMLYYHIFPTLNILLLPLLLVYMLMFCTGLSLLLSALTVFFRDIIHLWSVVTLAWMYATPIIYPYTILEEWMKTVMGFNPMYHYVTYAREILMWGNTPGLIENLICFGAGLVSLSLGLFVFRKTEKRFILHV